MWRCGTNVGLMQPNASQREHLLPLFLLFQFAPPPFAIIISYWVITARGRDLWPPHLLRFNDENMTTDTQREINNKYSQKHVDVMQPPTKAISSSSGLAPLSSLCLLLSCLLTHVAFLLSQWSTPLWGPIRSRLGHINDTIITYTQSKAAPLSSALT